MFNYNQLDVSKVDFYDIGPADLPNGERIFVDIGNQSIAVFNIGGQYFAIGDVCSHDDGPVGDGDVNGYTITCPRHGAEFDLRNGKVLMMPAVVDIPAYPVKIEGGNLFVGVPRE